MVDEFPVSTVVFPGFVVVHTILILFYLLSIAFLHQRGDALKQAGVASDPSCAKCGCDNAERSQIIELLDGNSPNHQSYEHVFTLLGNSIFDRQIPLHVAVILRGTDPMMGEIWHTSECPETASESQGACPLPCSLDCVSCAIQYSGEEVVLFQE